MPPVLEAGTENEEEEGAHDGACQFCGGCGPNATDAQLDFHYYQECPLLMECARCKQVRRRRRG